MLGKSRRVLTILLVAALIVLAGLASWLYYSRPATLVAVVEPKTGDAALLSALGAQLARERAAVRLTVREVPDEVAIRKAMDAGEADVAVVRADLGTPIDGRAVAVLRTNVLALLARSGGKIETPRDLAGRRIALVGNDVDPSQITAVLIQYGAAGTPWKPVAVEPGRLRAALAGNEIDAVAVAGPVTSQVMADAVAAFGDKGPVFIPVDQSEALVQRLPLFQSAEIAIGTFGGNPPKPAENVETISFAHYLLAKSSLADQTVGALARGLFEARGRLATEFPAAAQIAAASTAKDATVLAHPGATAYFNDSETTFFGRYGDWIYISAMVASLLGTLGVALANYLGSARLRRRALAKRLATLLKQASEATSREALAAVEAEANAILGRSMVGVEAGKLPPDALASFSLSIDLVRRAVAERRAELVEEPRPGAATAGQVVKEAPGAG